MLYMLDTNAASEAIRGNPLFDARLQALAPGMDAQRIDRVAMQPRYTADVVIDALIQQGDFHGLGVVGKQLQVNIVQACGGAAPYGAADQGFKRLQSLHPPQRQLAQGGQLTRLCVLAE